MWASASCGENGQARKIASTPCTARCKLSVVRRIDVHRLDVRRLDGQLAARLQQGADGSGTIGELGENRPAHSTRHIRHKQHGCTVTVETMINVWSDTLSGPAVAVNAFRSNFLVRHSQQLDAYNARRQGDCRQAAGALTLL